SAFFETLFSSDMNKGIYIDKDSGVTVIPVSGYLESETILRMVRIFCHTGTLEVFDGDSVEILLECYFASDFYGLEGALKLLHSMLVNQISPANVLRVYEILLRKGSCEGKVIEKEVEDYIATYAFVILKHKSFLQFPSDLLGNMCHLLRRDDLNILEKDLLWLVYKCCSHRCDGMMAHASPSNVSEHPSPMDLLLHHWTDHGAQSLWGSIRFAALTHTEFADFIFKNPTALEDADTVDIIKFLHIIKETPEENVEFRAISFYPRNLQLYGMRSPQSDVVYWDSQKMTAFFALQYDTKSAVSLNPIRFCKSYFHLELSHSENSIHMYGRAHPDQNAVSSVNTRADVKVTSSIVNFKHDRWKKKASVVPLSHSKVSEFSLNNILTWSTVEKVKKNEEADSSGYLFDIGYYPHYRAGTWMMVLVSIESM
ncbi:unnamed protein product, partial [Phaeothamnion confervicola]